MHIYEALQVLELNGGRIYCGGGKVVLYWGRNESWGDFKQCRITLSIDDLFSLDWKHSLETF